MRIVINGRSLLKSKPTGIGRYTEQLLDALAVYGAHHDLFLYCQKDLFDIKRSFPKIKHSNVFLKKDFFSLGVNRLIPSYEVYHAPSIEDISNIDGKVVVTLHDLVHKTVAQNLTAAMVETTQRYVEVMVKKAHRIICVSENTKNDLLKYFDVPEKNIRVVYHGINHDVFYPINQGKYLESQQWLASKGISGDFWLFVGTLESRKNLKGILEALVILQERNIHLPLIVVGMQGWGDDSKNLAKQLGIESKVMFMGFIPDQQLAYLYNHALGFIYPSFYEGFGFPVLEAMACGAAVLTSNSSSLKEVAGEAACLVNPHEPPAIAAGMKRILEDNQYRQELKDQALVHAKRFTWEKCAKETLEVYASCVN